MHKQIGVEGGDVTGSTSADEQLASRIMTGCGMSS